MDGKTSGSVLVIPVHDRVQFVEDAVRSAQQQTVPFDLIIVVSEVALPEFDDGPTPVVSVRTTISDITKVNYAVDLAYCKYVCVLCDDDMLAPTFLEECMEALSNSMYQIAYTDTMMFGSDAREVRSRGWLYENFNGGAPAPITGVLTKELWDFVGGYENIPYFDYDFWWKCYDADALGCHIHKPLFLYRTHSLQGSHSVDVAKSTEQVIQRAMKRADW